MMPSGENPADLSFVLSELRNYQKKTGVRVNTLADYDSVDTRLRLLQDIFGKKSPEPDICGIDNIWPGLLADDLIDLKPYVGDELTAIDKSLLDAFTVNGKLLALPETMETAVLYYRIDLLKKYGYQRPPQTWDELGRMAKVIQDGERKAGKADFWGYIWQGAEGECLNCNALEWQRAEGADLIDKSGAITACNPAAEYALKRARSWVGTISPPSVVEYDEEDASNLWLAGSAAFARGWPSLYGLSKDSPLLAKTFSTTPLPAGRKGYAWTFGGMGLAVSRYSVNPAAAAQVVRYLISPDVQRRRLLATSTMPSRTSLVNDLTLLQDTAFHGWPSQRWQMGMFARPAAITGKKYAVVSRAYSKAVHDVISGKRNSHEALIQLQAELVSLMRSPNL
jgi:trehalose/maltose transport system substrate-binding protein